MTKYLMLLLLLMSFSTKADEMPDPEFLKVCADPYMLPFSNKEQQGFENKIADLLASKLGLKVKYMFFPQRIGFVRNTLRAESEDGLGYKCDLIISAPSNFELAATTDPYYASTYALIYAKGRNLDSVTDPEMLGKFVNEVNNDIKIGLADRGPAQLWVFYNEMMSNMVPYQGQPGDPKANPGKKLIEEVVAGNIDATIVWGPTAGYYAKQYKDKAELVVLPLKDDPSKPEMRFTYPFAMAVRFGEKEWKEKINKTVKDNITEIHQILRDFGVPLVEIK